MHPTTHTHFLAAIYGFVDTRCELEFDITATANCEDIEWSKIDANPVVESIMGIDVNGKIYKMNVDTPLQLHISHGYIPDRQCEIELEVVISDCEAIGRILDKLRVS